MSAIDQINQGGTTYEIVPEIAELFSIEKTYRAGDHVIYEAGWYTFKTDKYAGAWDATKVDGPFKVTNQISELKEELTANEKAFGTVDLVLSAEVMLNKYVDNTGAVTTSSSWNAYKCDLSKYVIRKVSAWTNNAAFYAIAFYASNDAFLGGVKFGTNSSAQAVEIDSIETPNNASYAIISNRKATNPTVDIKGVYNGDYADIPTALDKISMESVIDCTDANYTLGNYYIASDGSIIASGSWTAYVISASIKKLYAKTISNEAAFYTIGFYSDDSMNNASFITGIKFLNPNNFVENTVLYIPQNAKKIVICTRTATSTEQVVEATALINYRVEQLETIVNDAGLTSPFGNNNVKAIYKNVPNTNDFAIIKDEIWFAENVYVDGVATDTTNIHRYKIVNGNLVKLSDMVTDFGHWNVVDYCEENDCLIFGNGANSTSTVGNYFSVIPHPLTLSGTVSIEDVGFKCPVDIGFKVQAVWGDNNFGKYDIAYVFANNATTICVIQLLKDANGDFTGEFRTLETLTSETSVGVGGADFWGDTLYIGDGGLYGLYKLSMTDLTAKRIVKKYYTESGALYSGTTQGVHVDSDYLWIFSNVGGSSENYLIQYYR